MTFQVALIAVFSLAGFRIPRPLTRRLSVSFSGANDCFIIRNRDGVPSQDNEDEYGFLFAEPRCTQTLLKSELFACQKGLGVAPFYKLIVWKLISVGW